jgi:Mrp family chromosome partitioning ATPase
VPPAVRESFRTLQIQMDQRRLDVPRPGRTIVVSSASSGDGKTTTAICLAVALGAAGHEVILVDCDLRRPDIGPQLGLSTATGLGSLLNGPARLDDLLQRMDRFPKLRVLTSGRGAGGDANTLLLTGRLQAILAEATALADYVILDTAPLGIVGDTLALARYADELLFVGRIGNTDRRAAANAFELLWRAQTPPTGWVVIGAAPVRRSDAYYYAAFDGTPDRRRRLRSPVG